MFLSEKCFFSGIDAPGIESEYIASAAKPDPNFRMTWSSRVVIQTTQETCGITKMPFLVK